MARKPRSNRNRRSGPGRASRPATNRQYPRTARLNALLQEIVADFFERVDDERFEMLTITGVEVDNDLNRAQVFVSDLGRVRPIDGSGEDEAAFLEALAEYRKPVQSKIAREARIRKTPEITFAIDPGVRAGARIEEILSDLRHDDEPGPDVGGDRDGPRPSGTPVDGGAGEVAGPGPGDGSPEHDGADGR